MTEENYEEMAKEYGWNPSGEKSAKDFIKYALDELPKRGDGLKAQNKKLEAKNSELSELKSVLNELTSHMNKQKEAAYNQALQDIANQRRQAIIDGDVALVDQLDQQKDTLQTPQPNISAVEEFQKRNDQWLSGTSAVELEMQAYTYQMDNTLGRKKLPPEKHIELLEEAIKRKFSSYFDSDTDEEVNPTVEAVQPDANIMGKRKQKSFGYNDLNDIQKSVANYLAQKGTKTVDQYIKELVELGELK